MAVDAATPVTTSFEPVHVERWPSERRLRALVGLAAAGIWLALSLSVVGLVYTLFIALFFFAAHVGMVAWLRGSGVRLGPDQFPELYARVRELAARLGMKDVPEAYLVQAGGVLNAFATKFLRSRFIVLYSDLVDACGANTKARDMVIGHELGHLKAGHLDWAWFLLPGFMVPFLGAAYSRAREYTCDRYGVALCGDRQAALTGLAILAAGGSHGPKVNLGAMARQRDALNTGFMTLGTWLASHPPLCDRIAALEPALVPEARPRRRGALRAVAFLVAPALAGVAVTGFVVTKALPEFRKMTERAQQQTAVAAHEASRRQAEAELKALVDVVHAHVRSTGRLPVDTAALYTYWRRTAGGAPELVDPFDGEPYAYGYSRDRRRFAVWSVGPDRESGTDDDIYLEAKVQR